MNMKLHRIGSNLGAYTSLTKSNVHYTAILRMPMAKIALPLPTGNTS
jgi:hypothetical protein